ncbi:MAG: helix-turn-helix domain-containing protein [Lentisphaeria bacterium]|nr:helix-turn-helix domain-containing protein [Lentisphaeria bacterium]
MSSLFVKHSYDNSFRSGWHIRKNLLQHTNFDNQSLQFYDFGHVICQKGGENAMNRSSNDTTWSIYFILKGNAKIFLNQNEYQLHQNHIILLDPTDQVYWKIPPHEELEVMHLTLVDSPVVLILLSRLHQERVFPASDPEQILFFLNKLERLLLQNLERATSIVLRDCAIYSYSLIAELSRQCLDFESLLSVRQVRMEITCNPWGDYKLSDLANKCGLSERSFERQFRKNFNCTLSQYVIGVKVAFACRLLKNTFYSIDEIFSMCRFSSKPFFYQVFKKVTGTTPAHYRGSSSHSNSSLINTLNIMKNHKLPPDRKNILFQIMNDPHITLAQIAEHLDLPRSVIRKNMDIMRKEGIIQHKGSCRTGYWVICDHPAPNPEKKFPSPG